MSCTKSICRNSLPQVLGLVHFDAQTDELSVARNEEEFLTVGRDGTARWSPWNPEGLKAWAGTLRRLEDGWVALGRLQGR